MLLARQCSKLARGVVLSIEAEDLEKRAESIGTGGISSDDPEAVAKLESKLLAAEEAHAAMIASNREAKAVRQPKPCANYQLSNSRGRINQIRDRIAALHRRDTLQLRDPVHGVGWTMREDANLNRIRFHFDAIPADGIRQLLKSRGFKWAPSIGDWVRMLNASGRFSADQFTSGLRDNEQQKI